MSDLDFIKEFSKIRILNVCKKLNIQRNNVYTGKTTKENIEKVKKEILRELTNLFVRYYNE